MGKIWKQPIMLSFSLKTSLYEHWLVTWINNVNNVIYPWVFNFFLNLAHNYYSIDWWFKSCWNSWRALSSFMDAHSLKLKITYFIPFKYNWWPNLTYKLIQLHIRLFVNFLIKYNSTSTWKLVMMSSMFWDIFLKWQVWV